VDFEKAYDSVDWGYLDKVMERMVFPTLWRKWIKECVGTATASVLVNGYLEWLKNLVLIPYIIFYQILIPNLGCRQH
ncbi:receptor-like kinase, partial [Trifolium medium]|nr:receptor-like kinase [Trifolium medium]